MATYRKRLTIEAEQFWPEKKPWPEGVSDDADPDTYWLDVGYDDNSAQVVEIHPGDWIITNGETYTVDFREFCRAVDFPNRYERVNWPSEKAKPKSEE